MFRKAKEEMQKQMNDNSYSYSYTRQNAGYPAYPSFDTKPTVDYSAQEHSINKIASKLTRKFMASAAEGDKEGNCLTKDQVFLVYKFVNTP